MKRNKIFRVIVFMLIFAMMIIFILPTYVFADDKFESPPSQEEQKLDILATDPGALFYEHLEEFPASSIMIDGAMVSIAPGEPACLFSSGHVYIPIRFVMEHLGAVLGPYGNSKDGLDGVIATKGSTVITEGVGDYFITVNGTAVKMDIPNIIVFYWVAAEERYGARNYVPIRYFAEALGYNYEFKNGTVILSSGKPSKCGSK